MQVLQKLRLVLIRITFGLTNSPQRSHERNKSLGQQQLLLILLGVIIVGAAIVLALSLIGAQSVQSNKDAMINDLNHLAAHAYQYRISSNSLGGGEGKYTGYNIPSALASNANGLYQCTVEQDVVTLKAISASNSDNTITAKVNSTGLFMSDGWRFTGDFQ